jgi:hypothetical protein
VFGKTETVGSCFTPTDSHTEGSALRAAGHIKILIPANQLLVMGLIIWSLSNPGFSLGLTVV